MQSSDSNNDGGTTWTDVTQGTTTTWSYAVQANPHSSNVPSLPTRRSSDLNVGNTASQLVTIDTAAPTATVAITAITSDTAPVGTNNDFVTKIGRPHV